MNNKDITVLVVDDDADVARGPLKALQDAGFTTLSASGGEAALRIVAERLPHVVLLDREMPGMNGLEVCRRIKGNAAFADVLVIIASETFKESRHQAEGLSSGADGFIVRPVTSIELVSRVETLSRLSVLSRELRRKGAESEAALAELRQRRRAELNLLEDAVAARKKAEMALKSLEESDLIFNRFMDNSPIYVFFKDENARALRLSRNFEKLVGMPVEAQLGKSMEELFPSDLARKMVEDDKRVLDEGRVVTVEEELNGRRYSTIKFPIVVDGKSRFLAGYTTDITEQSAAAKKLADSEALYRSLVSAMGEGLTLQDEAAAIIEFNPAAERILGLSGDQMLGKTSLDPRWRAIHEDGSPFPGESHPVPVALKTGLPQTDVIMGIHKPDGTLTWISVNALPMFREGEAKPYRVVATMHDVTARKRAEEELKTSERRFRETLDQLMEGAMILDFSWTCLYANPVLARHGRQQVSDLIGRNWLEIYPGIENTEVFAGYRRVMKERLPLRYEAPFEFANGETAWFELHVTPVSQGIFVMSREITEAKGIAERDAALLELEVAAGTLDQKALLQLGLDKLADLTRSKIGFLHFVNAAQDEISLITWSTATMASYCKVEYDNHYPVSKAGVWADSIRQKRAVIVNDYATASNKKGLPEGHAHLQRFVSVPVLDNGLVRMIVGVGNAARNYNESDVTTISQFSYEMYRIVGRHLAEAALRTAEEKFRGIVEQSMVGVYMLDKSTVSYANPRAEEIFGFGPGEMEGVPITEFMVADDLPKVEKELELIHADKSYVGHVEFRARHRGGKEVVVGAVGRQATLDGRPAVIGVVQDITEKLRADSRLAEYTARLERAISGTVGAVSQMMDLRDPYTAGHEKRVGELAALIGAEMGLDADAQLGLRVAGGVHDVGKITVPAEILARPGRLSPVEYEIIKTHAEQGYEVLKGVDFPWPVAEVARQHHERIDGSGYPRGLKGDEIILEARIMAVADVVEAMGTHRPYRPALGLDKALAEIRRGAGTAFDPLVVDACLRLFVEKGYRLPDS